MIDRFRVVSIVSGHYQMDIDDFRPITAGSSWVLIGCGWLQVVADGSGALQMASNGWL